MREAKERKTNTLSHDNFIQVGSNTYSGTVNNRSYL